MIPYLILLLGCQLVGETIVHMAGLAIPGPVVGMGLLFGGLVIRKSVPAGLDLVAQGLHKNLAVLFVPAGVGLVQFASVLADDAFALVLAVGLSTIAGIAVTGLLMQALVKRRPPRD